jgi:hypothetical protein
MKRVAVFLSVALCACGECGAEDSNSANYLVPGCQIFLRSRSQVQGLTVDELTRMAQCKGIIDAIAHVASQLPPNLSSCPPDGIDTASKRLAEEISHEETLTHDEFAMLLDLTRKA